MEEIRETDRAVDRVSELRQCGREHDEPRQDGHALQLLVDAADHLFDRRAGRLCGIGSDVQHVGSPGRKFQLHISVTLTPTALGALPAGSLTIGTNATTARTPSR